MNADPCGSGSTALLFYNRKVVACAGPDLKIEFEGIDDPKTVKKCVRDLGDVAYVDAKIGQHQVWTARIYFVELI